MIKKGDKVKFNKKYYVAEPDRGKTFVVASNPYNLCGRMVVQLKTENGQPTGHGGVAVEFLKTVGKKRDV